MSGCPSVPDLSPRPDPGERLIRLVHLSDPQLVDEESPARSLRTESLIAPSWRPQEAWGVHTLDATLRRVNALHAAGPPVDFAVITGDMCDLAQVNELQWFIDTMDGREVTPDSGAPDGLDRDVPEAINPKLPYATEGLTHEIPWYTCFGNHDGLATGNFLIDRTAPDPEDWIAPLIPAVARQIGFHGIAPDWNFMWPVADQSPAVLTGQGPLLIADTLRLDLDALEAGPIAPDPARRFLSRRDFIGAHLDSTSPPRGHGFTDGSLAREETWYSVRPVPEVPVRLIVFDSVADGEGYGLPLYYGSLDREHFEEFILPELEKARAAGEWVILASHHPSADFAVPFPAGTVRAREFRRRVAEFPNVVMHLAGHTHRNQAAIIDGPYPYLEIETGAIIDYPQEGRILDFYEEDGVIRVESRMFSHAEAPTAHSAESYRRAAIDFGVRDAKSRAVEGKALNDPSGQMTDRDFSVRLERRWK